MQVILTLPDYLSLSRIPLSVLFILSFSSSNQVGFAIAMIVVVICLFTDFADGYIARRYKIESLRGYMLDGLGDKAFYTAILITAVREGFTDILLCSLLIIRELSLYSLRVIQPENHLLKKLRTYSLVHAFFIRVYFLSFFVVTFLNLQKTETTQLLFWAQGLAWIALLVGMVGLGKQAKFMWLKETSLE